MRARLCQSGKAVAGRPVTTRLLLSVGTSWATPLSSRPWRATPTSGPASRIRLLRGVYRQYTLALFSFRAIAH